jgi:hypothetical protein
MENKPDLGPNQSRFMTYVIQYLEPLSIFDELSYFQDDEGLHIFAHPAIIYRDMIEGEYSPDKLKDFGYVQTVPSEAELSDEKALVEESLKAASSLVWGYINGGRVVLQENSV